MPIRVSSSSLLFLPRHVRARCGRQRTFCPIFAAILAAGAALLTTALAAEQGVLPPVAGHGPAAIRQSEPKFFVRADVDRAGRMYREGDRVSLHVVSEADAYLYVLYQQADGKVYQIFPNSGQADNRVKARQSVEIPGPDALFHWVIEPPFGQELVKVIASKGPLPALADPALREKIFNAVSQKRLDSVLSELNGKKGEDWTEHQVEITTYAASSEVPSTTPHRYGVFFGISHYEFNREVQEATGGKTSMDRPTNAHDARVLADLLHRLGGVEDVRVYTDGQTTRAKIEEAITGWLPSVSRPGDTVFIHFSTHAGRFPTPNADPSDLRHKYTYFMLPHDFTQGMIVRVLNKHRTEGKLAAALEPRLAAWSKIVEQAKSRRKAEWELIQQTCITDDMFAHWLQRLDGRQIVVILKTCNAGGFAAGGETKGEDEASTAPFFSSFLSGQMSRLKDIGQHETAIFAACASDEESFSLRVPDAVIQRWSRGVKGFGAADLKVDLSLFTYYIIDSLLQEPAPLTIDQSYQWCATKMKQYLDTLNAIQVKQGKAPLHQQTPQLFNFCQRPVYLKR